MQCGTLLVLQCGTLLVLQCGTLLVEKRILAQTGHYVATGGLRGMWRRIGESALVGVKREGAATPNVDSKSIPTSALASAPTSSPKNPTSPPTGIYAQVSGLRGDVVLRASPGGEGNAAAAIRTIHTMCETREMAFISSY